MKTSFFLAVLFTVSSLTVSAQVIIGENNNLQNVQITQNGEDVLKGNNYNVKSQDTYRAKPKRLVSKIKRDTVFEKDYVQILEIHEAWFGNNLISSDTISENIHKALIGGFVKIDTIKPKYSQIFEMEKKVITWLYIKDGTTSLVSEKFTESKWLFANTAKIIIATYIIGFTFLFLSRNKKSKVWRWIKNTVLLFCIISMTYGALATFSFTLDILLLFTIIGLFIFLYLGNIIDINNNEDNPGGVDIH